MKILQETRGRLARLLDRIVMRIKCKAGRHDWIVPTEDCCGEPYKRHGTRKCVTCGREERLSICTKTGKCTWWCMEDRLKSLKKFTDA